MASPGSNLAGARPPLTPTDPLTDEGPSFEWGGLTFTPDGKITSGDGTSIDYAGDRYLGIPLGNAIVSRAQMDGPLTIQIEHVGLIVVFDGSTWKTNLYESPLPVIDAPEEAEDDSLPKATDWIYVTFVGTPVIVPLEGGRIQVGPHYLPAEGELDFYDPILGLQMTRRAGSRKTLRISNGSNIWRLYCTRRSYRVLFGEPWGRWISCTPAYIPYVRTLSDKILSVVNSTTTKAILMWLLLVPCAFYFWPFIFYLGVAFQWHPDALPEWVLPDDVLDD